MSILVLKNKYYLEYLLLFRIFIAVSNNFLKVEITKNHRKMVVF
jgi:hypothetical protein